MSTEIIASAILRLVVFIVEAALIIGVAIWYEGGINFVEWKPETVIAAALCLFWATPSTKFYSDDD